MKGINLGDLGICGDFGETRDIRR